jgi:hypothetical protein
VTHHQHGEQKHPTLAWLKQLVEHPTQVLGVSDPRHWSELACHVRFAALESANVGALVAQEDGVSRAPFAQAGAHVRHFHRKAVEAETLFELPVAPRRPDGERTRWTECGKGGGNAAIVIEASVVGGREGRRAVVHVQEHNVKAPGVRSQRESHIPGLEADAPIS